MSKEFQSTLNQTIVGGGVPCTKQFHCTFFPVGLFHFSFMFEPGNKTGAARSKTHNTIKNTVCRFR